MKPAALVAIALLLATVPVATAADYSIRHYDLRVEPDFARQSVRVLTAVDIDNSAGAGSFDFRLNENYRIVSLRAGETEAKWERSGTDLTVFAPGKSGSVRLVFDTEGTPKNSGDENRPVIANDSVFLLWSDAFYPADFDRWATVTTTIVLPKRFQAIAPGKLVHTRVHGDTVEYRFEARRPTVAFSILADSRWIRSERNIGGFHLQTLLYPECQKYAEQIFATSSDVLQFFSELHGDYRFDQFSFVSMEGMYARRAFPGFVGYSPAYLEKEMARTGYDAHETSLLWWGYTARGSGPGSWQWNEGLGDYVEILYGEARRKPLPANFANFRRQYLETAAEQEPLFSELRGNTPQKFVHGKYPWLMQVMREGIGDAAFRHGIRLLFRRYRFQTFSIDQFVSTFEEASGQSLRWWREQWLGRKGIPSVEFSAAVEPDGKRYRVVCSLNQRGEVYRLPVEIGIRTASGVQIHRVLVEQKQYSMVLHSEEQPLSVQLDPEDKLLLHRVGPSPAGN